MASTDKEPEDDIEYVVEAIRAWRHNLQRGCREFNIKWLNYDESENTWEPENNLNCPHLERQFIESLSPEELAIFNDPKPRRLNGFLRHAQFKKFCGVSEPHDSDLDEDSDKPNKQRFYCLISFQDTNYPDEVSIDDFFKHRPSQALEFLEERLLIKHKKPKATSQQTNGK